MAPIALARTGYEVETVAQILSSAATIGQEHTLERKLRNSIESGDFATYVEKELASNRLSETVVPSVQLQPRSRGVVALLAFIGAVIFAGVGLVAIASGMSSGRTRSGREFVLTGSSATLSGLLAVFFAVLLIAFFVKQLPARIRKGTFLILFSMLIAALAFAFGRMAA